MLDTIEEALDAVSLGIDGLARAILLFSVWHGLDTAFRLASFEFSAQSVAVVASVGDERLPLANGVEHVVCAAAIMGLAGRQLEGHGQAVCVDQSVDLGGQPASRAPHASGVICVPSGGWRLGPLFFTFALLALAACW